MAHAHSRTTCKQFFSWNAVHMHVHRVTVEQKRNVNFNWPLLYTHALLRFGDLYMYMHVKPSAWFTCIRLSTLIQMSLIYSHPVFTTVKRILNLFYGHSTVWNVLFHFHGIPRFCISTIAGSAIIGLRTERIIFDMIYLRLEASYRHEIKSNV